MQPNWSNTESFLNQVGTRTELRAWGRRPSSPRGAHACDEGAFPLLKPLSPSSTVGFVRGHWACQPNLEKAPRKNHCSPFSFVIDGSKYNCKEQGWLPVGDFHDLSWNSLRGKSKSFVRGQLADAGENEVLKSLGHPSFVMSYMLITNNMSQSSGMRADFPSVSVHHLLARSLSLSSFLLSPTEIIPFIRAASSEGDRQKSADLLLPYVLHSIMVDRRGPGHRGGGRRGQAGRV